MAEFELDTPIVQTITIPKLKPIRIEWLDPNTITVTMIPIDTNGVLVPGGQPRTETFTGGEATAVVDAVKNILWPAVAQGVSARVGQPVTYVENS